jgi:8-oxo-dGTP pyrophosphatase MutT (NUDIX family)
MQPGRAATVLLLRDGEQGVEVLLLERRPDSGFVPGAFVFPGGAVDPLDDHAELHAVADGPDDAEASRQFGIASGGFAYRIAAIRETFEECGALLASPIGDERLVGGEVAARLAPVRPELEHGSTRLAQICHEHSLRLRTSRLRTFAHWITPAGAPRRYDTRFFVTAAPTAHPIAHDGTETVSSVWLTPSDAIRRFEAGSLPLIVPTERCLRALARMPRRARVPQADEVLAAIDENLADPAGPTDVADRGGHRLALTPDERLAGAALSRVGSAPEPEREGSAA